MINSGGIKIQAEEMEKLLRSFIPVPFVITSVPDQRLGQAVTLLLEGQPELLEGQPELKKSETNYRKYWNLIIVPVHMDDRLYSQTENGKVNRAKCRILAKQMLTTFYTHTLTP